MNMCNQHDIIKKGKTEIEIVFQIEGSFLMHCPQELLGYKSNYDDKHPTSHKSYESLRKDLSPKPRDDIFISMHVEIFPYSNNVPQIQLYEKLNSNEMDETLQYLREFSENYLSQFPDRKLSMLVIDSSGNSICITRFFHPIVLFEFGECLKTICETTPRDDSSSSKNSTLKKKGRDDTARTLQSLLSTNLGEKRRLSKSTKESFEMKTMDENITSGIEFTLTNKIQICARYVSLIPLHNSQLLHNQFVVLSAIVCCTYIII